MVVVAVFGIAIGLWWMGFGEDKSLGGQQASDFAGLSDESVIGKGRATWGTSAVDVAVGIDVERSIPRLELGEYAGASLIPVPDGTGGLVWETEENEGGMLVSGRGLWREYQVDVSWRFVADDPQSRLRVVVRDVPVSELLEGDVVGKIVVERPVQRFFDDKSRLWGAGEVERGSDGVVWAQWEGEAQALTLSRIVAEQARWNLLPGASEGALDVAFWRRSELDAEVMGCESMGEKVVDLVVQLDWTVGKSRPVVPAVLPHGYRAALVPVFGDLQSSRSVEMQAGAARSAEDWLSRARTLIYGHSSAEDPRYGNGGLLGAHFGGSVVVPAAWRDDVGVRELAVELEGTRVELIPDGKTAYLAGDSLCEQAFQADEAGVSVFIVPAEDDGGVVASSAGRAGHVQGLPKVVGVVALDGVRTSLTEGVFSQESLEGLLAEQDVLAISTPLVATRNPLIGLWHEALLSAERGGAWTLQSDVSRAFARGELLRETERLLISSVSGLQDYWRDRAVVDIWQGPDGEVVLYNGGAMRVEGFTFVVAGRVRLVADDGGSRPGVEIAYHGGVSYVSLDLEAGARQVVLLDEVGDGEVVGPSLIGVKWFVGGG